MLCPEVWNFEAPSSEFHVEREDFERDNCVGKLNSFHFSHIVSISLPDVVNIPKELTDILTKDTDYYKIQDLNLGELVKQNFIRGFIQEGNLSILSLSTNIDTDNAFCVTPQNKLILSLTKQTYQSSSLEGWPSHFCKRNKFKYIIKIDLSKLKCNGKEQRRLVECLSKLKFDVILNWEPSAEDVCPSSVAKYFYDLKYTVKACSVRHEERFSGNIKVPKFDFKTFDDDDCLDYMEWLGMFALKANLTEDDDDYCGYQVPEPFCTHQVKYAEFRGFFTSRKLIEFFKALRVYVVSNELPWLIIYSQGFSDSVVNWDERENHFYTNGDNSYAIFMNNDSFIYCCNKTSYKHYKSKYE